MTLFDERTLAARRHRAEQALGREAPLVLIAAGEPIPKPGGLDQTYPFLPHPLYYWLTGLRRSGGILAYDPDAGWTHFVRPITVAERLWEGGGEPPVGSDVAEFPRWLEKYGGRAIAVPASSVANIAPDGELTASVASQLDAARRPKDAAELEIVTRAIRATAAGFAKAREFLRPGVTERQIQIELEAEMWRQGAQELGFDTIVGAGPNAAVLHFAPSARVVGPQDVVLIDSGGQIDGYTADVTRTYPAEQFDFAQQAIYDIVLAGQLAAIEQCRVGVEWHDVHRAAAARMAEGMVELGLLRGTIDEILESGTIALFFPHGIGHMVGLGVRDVGGRAPGRPEGRMCCGARVRVDLPLEENFLMTAEPGLYFVDAILDDPARRAEHAARVDWERVDAWRRVGGVRIEDNVLVTRDGPHILTAEIAK